MRRIFPKEMDINTIYNGVLSSDSIFQIFEHIFYDENLSISQLASKTNISTSTTYKLIKLFQEPLMEHFGLGISTSPVRLLGAEKDIRTFYYQYFAEKYSPLTLDMDIPVENEVFDELLNMLGVDQWNASFANKYFYRIVLSVNLIRYLQGHHLDADFKDLTPQIEKFRSHHDVSDQLTNIFPAGLDDFAIYQILGSLAFERFFVSYDEYAQAVDKDELLLIAQKALKETIKAIEQTYDIFCPNPEEVCWLMNNVAVHAEMDYLAIPLLNDGKEKFVDRIEQMHPELFVYIDSRLELYCHLMNVMYSGSMRQHIIVSFYTFWEGFFREIIRTLCLTKVLVISKGGYHHASLLGNLLKIHFGERVAVQAYDGDVTDEKQILQTSCDLIVTNFPLDSLGDGSLPIVSVSDYLQAGDYREIEKKLKSF